MNFEYTVETVIECDIGLFANEKGKYGWILHSVVPKTPDSNTYGTTTGTTVYPSGPYYILVFQRLVK